MELKFRAWDKVANETFESPNERYRHKPKGLITNLYGKMMLRSSEKGYGALPFTLNEFYEWSISNKSFLIVFDGWVNSGYEKDFKPSADRINANEGYSFNNINWTFWKDNYYKGINETAIKRQKPIIMYKDDKKIGKFKSIDDARYFLEMKSNGNISENLRGKRKSVFGYNFIYENPELVEVE